MRSLERILEAPDNLEAFVAEVGAGLGAVYGEESKRDYLASGAHRFALTLAHPRVNAWAWREAGRVAGLLWATQRAGVGYICFIHVLRDFLGRGIEHALIRHAVADLRRCNVHAIVSECLCHNELDLAGAFGPLGLQRVERLLMIAPLTAPALACDTPPRSAPCEREDWYGAAGVIFDAYRDHPDRLIHPDVCARDSCERFVSSAANGAYGQSRLDYIRHISCEGRMAGMILGCEVAPRTGFVLQVAVRPEYQGRGLGGHLLRELAGEFRAAGLREAGLGVTASNPARRLYERLGFEARRPVDAYVWWRE
ncbi:MAG: GNAT family N-acetyltransferase [FCB group bacterium]|jgi:ribosomal protein S18 acetylase RimI-like enzyme|nr:GNAT family N-acetyltransferase [FCB group bacterium]